MNAAGARSRPISRSTSVADGSQRVPHRTPVEIQQADQHLANDAGAHGSETLTCLAHIGFAKNVVPERGLTRPAGSGRPHFVGRQRPLTHQERHVLARRQAHTLATHQVAHGQGLQIFPVGHTGQRDAQCEQRTNEPTINLLRAGSGRRAGEVEQPGPVDTVLSAHRPETQQVRQDGQGGRRPPHSTDTHA